MMEIAEGGLTFSFPDQCEAGKYDDWSFYRNQFQSMAGGSMAVDILCLAGGVAWLVEIKDYRQHPQTKLIDLCDEVAQKSTRYAVGPGGGERKRRRCLRAGTRMPSAGDAPVAGRTAPRTAERVVTNPATGGQSRQHGKETVSGIEGHRSQPGGCG